MSCDWLVRKQACLGPVGEYLGRCYNCGKRGHSWGKCSPSILGALTVLIIGPPDGLMGKEVEDWSPRIVLQVNSRARENNFYVRPRALFFLVCFSISLNVVVFRIVKVHCHIVLLPEMIAFDLLFDLRGEVSLRNC